MEVNQMEVTAIQMTMKIVVKRKRFFPTMPRKTGLHIKIGVSAGIVKKK